MRDIDYEWLDELEFIRHQKRKEYAEYQDRLADEEYAEMVAERMEIHAGKIC